MMKIIVVVPPISGLVVALRKELIGEPKNRTVIIYPSIPEMHGVASQLSSKLRTNQVVVDARLNNVDYVMIANMLKEHEESRRVNVLIVVSPDADVAECILKLTLEVKPKNQWIWELIPLQRAAA